MTRTTLAAPVTCTGVGAVATIPYSFPISAATDLVGVQRDLMGAETLLVLNTDYTVTGVGVSTGGNIVSVSAVPLGYTWVFRRVRDITQTTDLRNQGNYYPEVIEDALDKLTDLAQQHDEELDRCFMASPTDALSSYVLPILKDKEGYALGVVSGPALGLVANSAVSLAADLANTIDSSKGAGMVGYASATSYPAGTVGAALQATASASTPTYAEVQAETHQTFTAGGTAPSFTLTPSPAVTSLTTQGFTVPFTADGTTGSNTLNVSGLGAKALKQYDSTGALVAGVIKNGFIAKVKYNGTYWVILNPLPAASVSTGRLIGVSYYSTAGVTAYVKGTNNPSFIIVEGCGGGASGGSVSASGAANLAAGGGAGGYFRKKILASALAASETVTIGAGGASVSTTTVGNNGGTTSFGSHCSATGGEGGGKATSTSNVAVSGAAGGTATGGDLNLTGGGSSALASVATSATLGMASAGGNSFFGGGGQGGVTGALGTNVGNGGAPGAGGGGCAKMGSTSPTSGAGAAGIIIVWEYA